MMQTTHCLTYLVTIVILFYVKRHDTVESACEQLSNSIF